ncbi:MAG TPA: hypothetical protein VKB07_00560 [Gaiellaceae bacterium]|nr:hypothetical protein [Gaiellaceae bacterium]HKG43395.1 hypothetical protein [Gaiellaceae bacterium]
MYKIAAIIAGVLLLAGVALAGTVTSLDSTNTPTIASTPPTSASGSTSSRQEDRGREDEVRGRVNEPGEDLRGPCDEAEHADDARCASPSATPRRDDRVEDRSGRRGGGVDGSGRHGADDGGHSGHGGRGGD